MGSIRLLDFVPAELLPKQRVAGTDRKKEL